MDKARIAELLRPFLTWDLSTEQLDNISMYIDILLKWNQRMNLTAVRRPEEIVTRHFGESLFAAQALFPAHVGTAAPGRPVHVGAEPALSLSKGALTCPAERSSAPQTRASGDTRDEPRKDAPIVVDVGSGPGFPGLPIKIWAPEVRLILIESNHKKATFLKEIVRTLGLERVDVFTGRAETFPAASADVVTLRAVERFESILPIAVGLVRTDGYMALLIGRSQMEQAKAVAENLEWQNSISVPHSNYRILFSGHKN